MRIYLQAANGAWDFALTEFLQRLRILFELLCIKVRLHPVKKTSRQKIHIKSLYFLNGCTTKPTWANDVCVTHFKPFYYFSCCRKLHLQFASVLHVTNINCTQFFSFYVLLNNVFKIFKADWKNCLLALQLFLLILTLTVFVFFQYTQFLKAQDLLLN